AAAASAARSLASALLLPHLPLLEPHLRPQQLVTLLAALMPAGAAALHAAAHAYPTPSPPPPAPSSARGLLFSRGGAASAPGSGSSAAVAGGRGAAAAAAAGEQRAGAGGASGGGVGDQLAALAAALRRRTDPRTARDMRQLFLAWHALAAARVAGAGGSDDPRVVGALAAPVMASAVRHAGHLGSPNEVVRFVVSCAMLSVYDRAALDAMTAPLLASSAGAVGGNGGGGGAGSRPQQQQKGGGQRSVGRFAPVNGGGYGGGAGGGWSSLSPTSLAQLAWAVGQLGYDNQELLAAIQARALALSAPPAFGPAHMQLIGGPGGSGASSPAAAAASSGRGAAATAAAGGCEVGAPPLPGAPLLGPLELSDVMWGLAVNGLRTNRGAELRELYMRAASQGVVHIDDPRWLRLVRVHLLLLLGWAGGLGEQAAGQLRSGWFHALGYAWEHQAVSRCEHLAGPTGLPPDPDPAALAFRSSLLATARELLRGGGGGGLWGGSSSPDSGGVADSGDGVVGRWRLQPGYVWGMLQPSADIRLTLPLLARQVGGG
ncbi:hypothetical protein Agub_g11582, partial [Astrephomene gubernaculifera]